MTLQEYTQNSSTISTHTKYQMERIKCSSMLETRPINVNSKKLSQPLHDFSSEQSLKFRVDGSEKYRVGIDFRLWNNDQL